MQAQTSEADAALIAATPALRDALEALLYAGRDGPVLPRDAVHAQAKAALKAARGEDAAPTPAPAPPEDPDAAVLALVREHPDNVREIPDNVGAGRTGNWQRIVEAAKARHGMTEAQVEETLNRLLDRGMVYEPVLGHLKVT